MSEAPVRVDNLVLTVDTDFGALVHDILLGGGGVGSLRSDNFPLDWVFRAYEYLRGTPYAGLLAGGVAANLEAAEAEVRDQARIFFEHHPGAQ
jgi:hypothetical protein